MRPETTSFCSAAALLLVAITAGPAAAAPPGDAQLARAEALLAQADPENAAAALDLFGRDAKDDPRAPEALARAALLHFGLGQVDPAASDLLLLRQDWGTKRPDLAARIAIAWSAYHLEKGDARQARGDLEDFFRAIGRRAPLDLRAEAHATLGRALARLGEPTKAAAEYRKVIALADERAAAIARRKGEPPWGSGAIEAEAEARLFLADEQRAKADRIALAPYRGHSDRASVLAWLRTTAAPWLTRRRRANEELEYAYLTVFGVVPPRPLPPPPPLPPAVLWSQERDPNAPTLPWRARSDDPLAPEWKGAPPSPRRAIAAAERIGAIWSDFVATIRSLPTPPKQPGEGDLSSLRAAYFSLGYDALDELKIHAKHAYEACLRLSTRYRIVDDHTRACEAWLGQNYRAEHGRIDELAPQPIFQGPAVIAQPARR